MNIIEMSFNMENLILILILIKIKENISNVVLGYLVKHIINVTEPSVHFATGIM